MPIDQHYDAVILGSGIAGLATAVAARSLGLRTVVLEAAERVGGGTCYSTGLIWVGCNHLAQEQGIQDDMQSVQSYMNFLGGGQQDLRAMKALVESSAEALQFFESCGVRFRLLTLPDHYYKLYPAALPGGRTLEAELICGRALEDWEQRLVLPAAAPWTVTAEELFRSRTNGFPPGLLEQRKRDHMYGLGAGLIVHFLLAALRLGVELRVGQQTEELIRENGVVSGVRLRDKTIVHAARGVVLATGGYESNPEMVAHFEGIPGWVSYFPDSIRGEGLALGAACAAATSVIQHNMQLFLGFLIEPNPESEKHQGNARSAYQHAGIVELCSPHTLVVNRHGERFADESMFQLLAGKLREFDVREHTYRNLPCYLVFDQNYVDSYPFAGKPVGAVPEWVARGADLEELASGLNLPVRALAGTIARFNDFAYEGVDRDFGRSGDPRFPGRPTLGALERPPFYGLQLHPAGSSSAGLWTDENGQACTYDRSPIVGLYAVGNVAAKRELGTGYQAGLTIASGMTFGLRAARHMLGAPSSLAIPVV